MTASAPVYTAAIDPLPQRRGFALCLACGNDWQAVADVNCERLTCPKCHLDKGRWRIEGARAVDFAPEPVPAVQTAAGWAVVAASVAMMLGGLGLAGLAVLRAMGV
jgi:hypothetical protein